MIALVNNYIIGSTITALTENPDYDFTTAFNDDRLSRVSRTVDDNAQTIDFDLLGSQSVSKLMIQDHNLTSGVTASLDAFTNNPLVDPTVMNLPLVSDALDISGNGNGGTATDITWAGGVANFNGVSSDIAVSGYTHGAEFSYYCIFKINDTTGYNTIFAKREGAGDSHNNLIAVSQDGTPNMIIGFATSATTKTDIIIASFVSVGVETAILITYDGLSIKVYKNNILVLNQLATIYNSNSALTLGKDTLSGSSYLGGTMSQFSLFNRALTTAEATALYTVNDYFTPDYTTAITYNADYIYKDLVTPQTFRYWRLSISDASNPDGYLEISKVYLGGFVQFPNMRKDQKIPVASTSQSSFSASGQVYGNFGYTYRYGTINFYNITNTERQAINSAFETIDKVKPFYLLVWESDLTLESPVYCVLTADLVFTRIDVIGLKWELPLSFREVK